MKNIITFLSLFICTLSYGQKSKNFKPYYSNNLNLGIGLGISDAYTDTDFILVGNFDYVGLFHLNPKIAVGAGIGFRQYANFGAGNKSDVLSLGAINNYFVPLYLHARFRFIKRKVSPYLNFSFGYNNYVGSNAEKVDFYEDSNYPLTDYKLNSGWMTNASLGVSINLKNRKSILFGPYLEYFRSKERVDVSIYEETKFSSRLVSDSKTYNFIDVLQLGLKVGFSF